MKNKIAMLAISAMFAAGCASSGTPFSKTVMIDSQPQGAHVFMKSGKNERSVTGNDFIGTTPFRWNAITEGNGAFKIENGGIPFYSDLVQCVVVFTAEPPSGATNLFTKKEVYHGNAQFQPGDKVPDGIFFDLTKP